MIKKFSITWKKTKLGAVDGRLFIYACKMYFVGATLLFSVVSINGVVTSVAVTEFAVGVTGIRKPRRNITYYGHFGKVTDGTDEPRADCYYYNSIRGIKDKADIKRYITINTGLLEKRV